METTRLKRYAAHEVIVGDKSIPMCVVEMTDGFVTGYHTFSEELPFTEWLGGTINIVEDKEGRQVALWNNKIRLYENR